jgi:septum site-determining protein MinD
VLKASNTGTPVILDEASIAGKAYADAVSRLMGEQTEIRMFQERRGLFQRFLRRTA